MVAEELLCTFSSPGNGEVDALQLASDAGGALLEIPLNLVLGKLCGKA